MSEQDTKQKMIELADEYKQKQMTGSKMYKLIVWGLKQYYNYDYE